MNLKRHPNVTIVSSPIVNDCLVHLRDEKTDMQTFRYYADRLSHSVVNSMILDSDTISVQIKTPLAKTLGDKISGDFVVVCVLRSGIAMLNSALKLLPFSKVGFAGIFRDEKTSLPHEYYWKMPMITKETTVLILDPMLATGGTLVHVIGKLMEKSPKEVRIGSIVAAPEGVHAVCDAYPDLKIFLSALDQRLNTQRYIVPGLGDFGDRYFGTES